MNIKDMQIFIDVAQSKGISAASRRLSMSKSMISRCILRLEDELGTKLLSRTTRGVVITEAGHTFYEHAVKIIGEVDTAKERIMPEGDLRGTLRIAMPLTFGPDQLAPVLAKLAKEHPKLEIHSCYSDRHVDIVEEGFDCAIRIGHLKDSNLIAKCVGPIYGTLVASQSYIKEYPLWSRTEKHGLINERFGIGKKRRLNHKSGESHAVTQ